jgi:hypothetical protein
MPVAVLLVSIKLIILAVEITFKAWVGNTDDSHFEQTISGSQEWIASLFVLLVFSALITKERYRNGSKPWFNKWVSTVVCKYQ